MMETNFCRTTLKAVREAEYYQALKLYYVPFATGIRTNVSTWDHCCDVFSWAGAELRSVGRRIGIADPDVPSHPLNEILP